MALFGLAASRLWWARRCRRPCRQESRGAVRVGMHLDRSPAPCSPASFRHRIETTPARGPRPRQREQPSHPAPQAVAIRTHPLTGAGRAKNIPSDPGNQFLKRENRRSLSRICRKLCKALTLIGKSGRPQRRQLRPPEEGRGEAVMLLTATRGHLIPCEIPATTSRSRSIAGRCCRARSAPACLRRT